MALSRAAVYAMVGRIPAGRVATYGQIAGLLGSPRAARQVGQALSALEPGTGVPWHRVINARGRISPRGLDGNDDQQRVLLEAEGLVFDATDSLSLDHYGWAGPG